MIIMNKIIYRYINNITIVPSNVFNNTDNPKIEDKGKMFILHKFLNKNNILEILEKFK